MADPVEAFLERERNDLADIGDDSFVANGNSNGGMDEFSNDDSGSHLVNGFRDQSATAPGAPVMSTPAPPRPEPEKIKRWREEQKVRLEKKDAEEDKERAKLREQAKKEIEDWYKNREKDMEKAKKNNRIAEQDFVKERDADQPGQEWERITRLCEFNPKAAKNAKDVSRFRSILLQLKQTPVGKN